jgi:hypothetical protein
LPVLGVLLSKFLTVVQGPGRQISAPQGEGC